MASAKVGVSMDKDLLVELDRLVQDQHFSSRSQVVQQAVREKLRKLKRARFLRECAKFDPAEEQRFADADITGDLSGWPEY